MPGAVLPIGLPGGAMAARRCVGNPVFGHLPFGAWVGMLAWGSLSLSDAGLLAILPLRR